MHQQTSHKSSIEVGSSSNAFQTNIAIGIGINTPFDFICKKLTILEMFVKKTTQRTSSKSHAHQSTDEFIRRLKPKQHLENRKITSVRRQTRALPMRLVPSQTRATSVYHDSKRTQRFRKEMKKDEELLNYFSDLSNTIWTCQQQ